MIHWILTLIFILFDLVYICVGLMWLILGSILNAKDFLPYSAAAITLITVITSKHRSFAVLIEKTSLYLDR